jgi:hypothetical protein
VSTSYAGVAERLTAHIDQSNSRETNAEKQRVQIVQITILILNNTKELSRLSSGFTPRKCAMRRNAAEVPSLGIVQLHSAAALPPGDWPTLESSEEKNPDAQPGLDRRWSNQYAIIHWDIY